MCDSIHISDHILILTGIIGKTLVFPSTCLFPFYYIKHNILSESTDPKKLNPIEEEIKNAMISESFRTAMSMGYAMLVFLLASFVLAVVHDRVPDARSYPPLPDVVLENIPLMPWAFDVCEVNHVNLSLFILCCPFGLCHFFATLH